MTDNTMREALIKFGDENPSLDLDFRLHTHGKYLTQEKAIVASRAFKAGAAWQAARAVPVEVFDSHCNYASFAGRVCNKCGRIHDGGKSVAVVREPVAQEPKK